MDVITQVEVSGGTIIEKTHKNVEIAENEKRARRCYFNVENELGQVERLEKSIKSIISSDEGTAISLAMALVRFD